MPGPTNLVRLSQGTFVRLALSLGMLIILPGLSEGATIRITCADGGADLVEGDRRSFLSAGFCDADHACDGFCTFAFDPLCPLCITRSTLCSPDGFVEVCPGLGAPPCPSGLPHVVLNLPENKRQTHKRMHIRVKHRHFTLVLRCRHGFACSPPPQAPPPGMPDLSGDWDLQETTSDGDCPATLVADLTTPRRVRLVQNGPTLVACVGVDESVAGGVSPIAQGSVSASGFTLATPFIPFGAKDYSQSFTAPLPEDGGPVTVTEEWSFMPPAPSGGPIFCRKSAVATMSRIPSSPCQGDTECIAADTCTRCSKGFCARSPFCQ